MTPCVRCRDRVASIGLLCAPCSDALPNGAGLCPEQVASTPRPGAGMCLVDGWGRPHRLGRRTMVGRSGDLALLCASISRKHAVVEGGPDDWLVIDLDSRNGTFVNERAVHEDATLHPGDIVRFGAVAFVFVSVTATATSPPHSGTAPFTTMTDDDTDSQPPRDHAAATGPEIRLVERPGGGGGVVTRGDDALGLTVMQFALLEALDERRHAERRAPEAIRGFIRTVELLTDLPWSTCTPSDVGLRHLVARLRRRLEPLGLAIEGRHGLGYRLVQAHPADQSGD